MALDHDKFWRTARATRMSVIVDAEAYFSNARLAMLQAKRRIMLIGWDFDARIELVSGGRLPEEPADVGGFIYWLVERNPELEVFLLRWDVGALKTLLRGSNIGTIAKWMRHPRIHTRLDSFHPTGGSHHQKIVVIDDCLAFCGGIDMTSERWDTREHLDVDPGRKDPKGKAYGPWHDATTSLQGPLPLRLANCRAIVGRAPVVIHLILCRSKPIAGPKACIPISMTLTWALLRRDRNAGMPRGARNRGAVRCPDRGGQKQHLR